MYKPEAKNVAVILINWNGYEDTTACLESLRKINYDPLKVVVVDNNSTEQEGEKLKECFPDIELIQNGTNRGFAGANNDGLTWAKTKGYKTAWILNNDTVVEPDSLRYQINHLMNEDIAAVGSKILYSENQRIWSRGVRLFDFSLKFPFIHFCSNVDEGKLDSKNQKAEDVAYISGCSILLRTDAAEAYFNEHYFAYCEDMDLCYRLKKEGYRLIYEPKSVVRHKATRSTGGKKFNNITLYYSTRNKLYFIRDNLGLSGLFLLPIYGLNLFQTGLRILLFSRYKKDLLNAVIHGFFDGIKYCLRISGQMKK